MWRILLIAAVACASSGMAAGIGSFERMPRRVALFAFDEPDIEPRAPVPETDPFALSFWLSPFLRWAERPDAAGPGFGVEGAYFFSQKLALTASAGLYSLYADVYDEDGRYDEKDANGFELTAGVRWRFFNYGRGALYLEFRGMYAGYGGSRPIRTTYSVGGGAHFGFEFGGPVVRGYIESGVMFLGAVNYSNSGWLFNGAGNGDIGTHIELIRAGIRIYV
jgi:hypothetical protein